MRSTTSPIACKHIVARDGANAVAFYLSGQMLTEDYYVANKLMKGFVGLGQCRQPIRGSAWRLPSPAIAAPSVPTHGCRAVTRISTRRTCWCWSASNAAWCHPVTFQRMLANKQKRGARMIVIDPRRTNTA